MQCALAILLNEETGSIQIKLIKGAYTCYLSCKRH